MAIELTRKRLRSVMANGSQPLVIPPHVLVGAVAAIFAITVASMLLGIRDAHRDADLAHRQFADAQALLALPPIDTSAIEMQFDAAKFSLAAEQALAAAPSVDSSSDAASSLLVRESEAAGLSVKGISRIPASTAKLPDATYDVQGIRLSVEGAPRELLTMLSDLHKAEPSLIPVLASMTINESGIAHAEIGFNVYTPLAKATAVAPPPSRKAKP